MMKLKLVNNAFGIPEPAGGEAFSPDKLTWYWFLYLHSIKKDSGWDMAKDIMIDFCQNAGRMLLKSA